MKKYMVLYLSSVAAGDQVAELTTDRPAARPDAWQAWRKAAGDTVVEAGSSLGAAQHLVFGAASKSNLPVIGYSIIQAMSLDDAGHKLKDHPHLQAAGGPAIEILEFTPFFEGSTTS